MTSILPVPELSTIQRSQVRCNTDMYPSQAELHRQHQLKNKQQKREASCPPLYSKTKDN